MHTSGVRRFQQTGNGPGSCGHHFDPESLVSILLTFRQMKTVCRSRCRGRLYPSSNAMTRNKANLHRCRFLRRYDQRPHIYRGNACASMHGKARGRHGLADDCIALLICSDIHETAPSVCTCFAMFRCTWNKDLPWWKFLHWLLGLGSSSFQEPSNTTTMICTEQFWAWQLWCLPIRPTSLGPCTETIGSGLLLTLMLAKKAGPQNFPRTQPPNLLLN